MKSLNKVQIIGNVGQDPDCRTTPRGTKIARLSVATGYKPREGDEVTEWHRVIVFNRLAEIVGEYVKKGSRVYVEGRNHTRKWEGQDGVERYTTEVVAHDIILLGEARQGGGQSTGEQWGQTLGGGRRPPDDGAGDQGSFDSFDDDIPF